MEVLPEDDGRLGKDGRVTTVGLRVGKDGRVADEGR